jgi:RecA/RadA recombinase
VCARGGTVLYIDWENDIVPDYAEALGVPILDPEKFQLHQPDTLEDGIKLAMVFATAGVDLIIFDSIGSAIPARIANRELEEAGEQSRVGEEQQVWSRELPNLKRIINQKGTCVFGISQIRSKIGMTGYGPTPQPQGGKRKDSFCARMSGMPGPMKDEKGKPTRKAAALARWKC